MGWTLLWIRKYTICAAGTLKRQRNAPGNIRRHSWKQEEQRRSGKRMILKSMWDMKSRPRQKGIFPLQCRELRTGPRPAVKQDTITLIWRIIRWLRWQMSWAVTMSGLPMKAYSARWKIERRKTVLPSGPAQRADLQELRIKPRFTWMKTEIRLLCLINMRLPPELMGNWSLR